MNLLENHAQTFRRNFWRAVILYASVGIMSAGWGLASLSMEAEIEPQPFITIKKEDTQTMEGVKNQLKALFAVPLPGISFSVLSLDEEGMWVRGNARSVALLETWLGHVSEVFTVVSHSSQQKSGKGLVFEVLLHEVAHLNPVQLPLTVGQPCTWEKSDTGWHMTSDFTTVYDCVMHEENTRAVASMHLQKNIMGVSVVLGFDEMPA